uniref:RNA-dependent RNA polymerase n=1 Tax=Soybean thrips sobemo-like virus 10 TaxID=2803988 RepID=A0A7T8IML9_9VIRU|nr:RNA-dependent RNA polymerase [Soybean thrips sobemo-like virus 10]
MPIPWGFEHCGIIGGVPKRTRYYWNEQVLRAFERVAGVSISGYNVAESGQQEETGIRGDTEVRQCDAGYQSGEHLTITVNQPTEYTDVVMRMKNRVQPPLDGDAELESLNAHSQYFKQTFASYQPSDDEYNWILYVMEDYYKEIHTSCEGWDSYENFLTCLHLLEMTSSPGYPYNKDQPTIGKWLGFNGLLFDEDRVALLWSSVQTLMQDEEVDCLWRVFIKKEPHKLDKVANKRWRIIQCCPLHVQVLWQMLFARQNDSEIRAAMTLPSVQGMRIPYGGWKYYYNKWIRNGTIMGADKKAWDWTVQEWMIRLDLDLRIRLTNGNEKWIKQANKLYRNAFYDCKILLTNGMILQQVKPGVMKSGCVNTISTNSHCQVMLHLLYCYKKNINYIPMVVAVGDDTLNHPKHLEDIPLMESFGVIIKSVSDTLEFLGREWDEKGPRAMYTSKHLFRLATQEDDLVAETLDAYLREYVNCDKEYNFLIQLAMELSLISKVQSRSSYKFWLDNPLAEWHKIRDL